MEPQRINQYRYPLRGPTAHRSSTSEMPGRDGTGGKHCAEASGYRARVGSELSNRENSSQAASLPLLNSQQISVQTPRRLKQGEGRRGLSDPFVAAW